MNVLPAAGMAAISAGLVSALLTLFLIRFSFRLDLMAQPRVDRWHKQPTPNTGGLAILTAAVIIYMAVVPGHYGQIVTAAVLVSLLGFLDDRIQLNPPIKFAGQSVAALVVIANGVVFRATPWELLNYALSFLWIVGITNAFNLIDNMDGLCGGVTVIISGFRCWFALANGDAACALIMAVLGGSFLGFLVFNYKPAKIFMGDCGSMLAGFLLGALTIASPLPRTGVVLSALLYPALTFLYPILDTVLVSVLRRAAGRPISVGGRDHSSHRLVSMGLSEQRVVWLLWVLTAIGSAAGLVIYSIPFSVLALAVLLIAGCTMFGVFLRTLPN
jgi:UDP-GlcNAc:undecaprenyl-phosphate/decaprenyl-phosphate GlcNAc-1-phosphate transferase